MLVCGLVECKCQCPWALRPGCYDNQSEMDSEQVSRFFEHKLTIAILTAIVSVTATVFLSRWVDRNKPPTLISVVAPTAQEDERGQLVAMRKLADKMWNEANYNESADFNKNAVAFRDADEAEAIGYDNRDNLELIFRTVQEELSVYISQCGTEPPTRHPRPDGMVSCEVVREFYLKPSLDILSRALQRRLDKMK